MAETATPSKAALAEQSIKKHMLAAVAVGVTPLPWVELAALTGLQLNLLRCLAKIYAVEFSTQIGKSAIGALVGSDLSVALSVHLWPRQGLRAAFRVWQHLPDLRPRTGQSLLCPAIRARQRRGAEKLRRSEALNPLRVLSVRIHHPTAHSHSNKS